MIKRFEINFPNEAHRSKELFTDMLRYLWLCEKHFERVGIYLCERYCPLQGQGLTYTHVYVGAGCAFPPN